MSVLKELKRRNVFKVGVAYVIVAWLVAQVADLALGGFGAAEWVLKTVLFLLVIGFPIALFFAWVFELTPEGIKREIDVRESQSIAYLTGRKLDFLIIGMLSACVLFLIADNYLLSGRTSEGPEASTNSTTDGQIAIAVLPFVNLSDVPGNEYFSDGLTDELQNQLTRIPKLRVLSRTSTFALSDRGFDIPAIAARLGVSKVVEGSVRRSSDRVRIAAHLIDVESDSPLWSATYDTEIEGIFEVQDEIAQHIVEALKVNLSATEQQALKLDRASSVEAYDYYLRGAYYLGLTTRDGYSVAQEMFGKAIEVDPDYAPAYTGLVTVHVSTFRTYDSSAEHLARADKLSLRALELAPGLAQSHVARGLFLTANNQYEEAEHMLKSAVELNPRLASAYYYYGGLTFIQGNFAQTAELWEKALEFEPDNKKILAVLPQVYRSLGRDDEAFETWGRVAEIMQRSLEVNPDDINELLRLATAKLVLGEREDSLELTERVLMLASDDAYVLYNASCLFALANETEKALETLEKSVQAGFSDAEWMQHDSDLETIRNHRRFKDLVTRIGSAP